MMELHHVGTSWRQLPATLAPATVAENLDQYCFRLKAKRRIFALRIYVENTRDRDAAYVGEVGLMAP